MKMKLGMATLLVMFASTGAWAALHSENFDSYADGERVDSQGDWQVAYFNSGQHGISDPITVTGGAATDGWGPGVGNAVGMAIDPAWGDKITISGDAQVSNGWVRMAAGPKSSVLETTDGENHNYVFLNFDNRGHFTEARLWSEAFGHPKIPTNIVVPGSGFVDGPARFDFHLDNSNGEYSLDITAVGGDTYSSPTGTFQAGGFEAFGIYGQASGWSWDNITVTPEPASLGLLSLGGLLMLRRRRSS